MWVVFADPREVISGVRVRITIPYSLDVKLKISVYKGPTGGNATCFQSAELKVVECRPVCPTAYVPSKLAS